MGDGVADVSVVNIAAQVWWEGSPHVPDLLIREAVALSLEQALKIVLLDGAFTLWVQRLEGSSNDILGVRALQSFPKHSEEGCEVDRPLGFIHHGIQLILWDIKTAHGCVGVYQVVLADDAITVLVNDSEGLLQFLDFVLIEDGGDGARSSG